jgi:hypothetical protein
MDAGGVGPEDVVARGGAERRGTRGAGAVSPVSSSRPRGPGADPESSGPESSGNDPGTLAQDGSRVGSAAPEFPSALSVGPPGPGDHEALLALLGGALRRDPLLGWCLRVERHGYLGRLWNYLESMIDRHRALGRPLQVCRWQGQPAGVLLGCGPEDRIGPEEVRELRTRLAIACGREEARRLFEAHGALCVFCGSSTGDSPAYEAAARAFGTMLAAAGYRLVYGGASVGLMGAWPTRRSRRAARSSASSRRRWSEARWRMAG